jgi:hypothetical protein
MSEPKFKVGDPVKVVILLFPLGKKKALSKVTYTVKEVKKDKVKNKTIYLYSLVGNAIKARYFFTEDRLSKAK